MKLYEFRKNSISTQIFPIGIFEVKTDSLGCYVLYITAKNEKDAYKIGNELLKDIINED